MCNHTHTRTIDTAPFSGHVSGRWYQNPAASGNVTVTIECCSCGARQRRNINGEHVEAGPWSASRTEREVDRQRRVEELRASLPETTLTHRDGRAVRLRVDLNGSIVFAGGPYREREEAQMLRAWPKGVEHALALAEALQPA